MTKTYELHATITPHYIYRAIAQSPVILYNGNAISYTEIGIIENETYKYHNKSKEVIISNCTIQLFEITSE